VIGLSRRHCLAAALLPVLPRRVLATAAAGRHEVPVAGFDAIDWHAVGDLEIVQSGRERLVITAEQPVFERIVAGVRGRTLHIRFEAGPVNTRQPLRFRIEVRSLSSLSVDGAGDAQAGPLAVQALQLRLRGSVATRLASLHASALEARVEGSGPLHIGGGAVGRQRVVISGAADVTAPTLASREAEVSIEGSGEVRIAVSERLSARIDGSGDIAYHGSPQVRSEVAGAGRVHRVDGAR
jgi:hypothetical protein